MQDILVLDELCKRFHAKTVVDRVSLTVGEGEIFGFLGPNGAGKTTTIKMILGLLTPDSGRVLVNGHDVQTDHVAAMRCVSGIVENPDMYGYLSGYDNLKLQARAAQVPLTRIDSVVELVGMEQRIREPFKSYSLGMKQRLGVAQALLREPKMMILDEPTNGLDPAGIKEFRDLLRRLSRETGLSVLVSSHILQEMQLMCDRVAIINRGRLLRTGRMEELIAGGKETYRYQLYPAPQGAALLRDAFGERVSVGEDGTVELSVSQEDVDTANRLLLTNNVSIRGLCRVSSSLEQVYMDITGGGNPIA